jgi:hypothetical protein
MKAATLSGERRSAAGERLHHRSAWPAAEQHVQRVKSQFLFSRQLAFGFSAFHFSLYPQEISKRASKFTAPMQPLYLLQVRGGEGAVRAF